MENWNPVLKELVLIKKDYEKYFGKIDYNITSNYTNILEQWVDLLSKKGITEHKKLLSPLLINQYDNFVLLKYKSLIDAYSIENFWDIHDSFYRECRGVVIDIKEEKLVLTPYRKFQNMNEDKSITEEIVREKIKHAKVVEFSNKLDGSMQSASWYNGKLIMAGSQALDINNSWRLKFGYDFINARPNYIQMIQDHPQNTYIFEFISPDNAIVVHYDKSQEGLYLTGIRSKETGIESSYKDVLETAKRYNILTTEVFQTDLDNVISNLDTKKSDEAEGFVLNIDGWKCKIKYNDYVNIHKYLAGLISPNLIIKNVADGTIDDLLSKIPTSHKPTAINIINEINNDIDNIDKAVQKIYKQAPKTDKKTFMIYIQKNAPKELKSYCINLYLGKNLNYLEKKDSYIKFNQLQKESEIAEKIIFSKNKVKNNEIDGEKSISRFVYILLLRNAPFWWGVFLLQKPYTSYTSNPTHYVYPPKSPKGDFP